MVTIIDPRTVNSDTTNNSSQVSNVKIIDPKSVGGDISNISTSQVRIINPKTNKEVISIPTENKSIVSKIGGVAKEFTKAIVEPIATLAARPIQLASELLGASDEQVNEFTNKFSGGFISPTPQNEADVKKDIGRAIQTVALAIPAEKVATVFGKTIPALSESVGKIGARAIEGATFGTGMSMEAGNKMLSPETAKTVGLTSALSVGIPVALSGVSKLFNRGAEKLTAKDITKAISEGVPSEIKPLESNIVGDASKELKPEPIQANKQSALSTLAKTPEQQKSIIKEASNSYDKAEGTTDNFISTNHEKVIADLLNNHTEKEILYPVLNNLKTTDYPITAYKEVAKMIAKKYEQAGDYSISKELSRVVKKIASESAQAFEFNKIAGKNNLTEKFADIRQAIKENMPKFVRKNVDAAENSVNKITKEIFDGIEKASKLRPIDEVVDEVLEFIKC